MGSVLSYITTVKIFFSNRLTLSILLFLAAGLLEIDFVS